MADEHYSTDSGLIPDDSERKLSLPSEMVSRGLELAIKIERERGIENHQKPTIKSPGLLYGTGITTCVSVDSDGRPSNDYSYHPSISGDGRYVAFLSLAKNLVSGDTNGAADVFVHDQQTRQTTRVSVAPNGTQRNYSCYRPSISADGRYVAYGSGAERRVRGSRPSRLVRGDTNRAAGVFVHDRQTGQTTLVSVASDGAQGNYRSASDPSISGDGRYVAFDGGWDVFVHDRQTGQTIRVSVATDGKQSNARSSHPSISGDGRYVAFLSYASNLVSGDTNGAPGVFVHDRQTGQTTLVSVSSDGVQGNDRSSWPFISADGRYVAFSSHASNLVSGDTNSTGDVFVHDRNTGQTTRVSVASDGTQANDVSDGPSISSDGRYVAYTSWASNLVVGDTNGKVDVFVHDRSMGQTTRVSVASDGTQGNRRSMHAHLSASGRHVAFGSRASNLVSGDTNGKLDVFAYDRGE